MFGGSKANPHVRYDWKTATAVGVRVPFQCSGHSDKTKASTLWSVQKHQLGREHPQSCANAELACRLVTWGWPWAEHLILVTWRLWQRREQTWVLSRLAGTICQKKFLWSWLLLKLLLPQWLTGALWTPFPMFASNVICRGFTTGSLITKHFR